jgi:hypothetical protein
MNDWRVHEARVLIVGGHPDLASLHE